jgi:hypothetical protein
MSRLIVTGIALALSTCATVHQEDLDAWAGHPVSELDVHPIFLTMRLELGQPLKCSLSVAGMVRDLAVGGTSRNHIVRS